VLTTKLFIYRSRLRDVVKSKEFYTEQANNDQLERCYFYNIDHKGRLFLEETKPKNIATSIKDVRFLNFFFLQIRRCNEADHTLMHRRGIPTTDYPFVSPCGKREFNFIRPIIAPIVFHELAKPVNGAHGGPLLVFAGDLKQEFNEQHLAVSYESGRLYHRILHPKMASLEYGLIKSSVGVELAERLEVNEEGSFTIRLDNDCVVRIAVLPATAEEAPWGIINKRLDQ
jgi:Domain of unknown function (DUF4505)